MMFLGNDFNSLKSLSILTLAGDILLKSLGERDDEAFEVESSLPACFFSCSSRFFCCSCLSLS